MFKNDYNPEDYNVEIKEGEYGATIKQVNERMSKNNNQLIEISLVINGINFFYHLVEGEYFNRNATRFFDAFRIRHGDWDYQNWIGKRGCVEIGKAPPNANGRQFMEVKRLLVKNVAEQNNAPPNYMQQEHYAPPPQQNFAPTAYPPVTSYQQPPAFDDSKIPF
ncbi:MAG: hypothetical protein Ta2B_09490 [Termitinemataceae bacterium]|nr:MAG: hypothetical protein Ta2B_09490 [Termitinemataceae bacterium]